MPSGVRIPSSPPGYDDVPAKGTFFVRTYACKPAAAAKDRHFGGRPPAMVSRPDRRGRAARPCRRARPPRRLSSRLASDFASFSLCCTVFGRPISRDRIFTPPFTCDNGSALFALWRLGIQKPCNMRDFWQIPTSDWMKREDARSRGPQRAKRPRRGAPPARTPPGRSAENARGAALPAVGALPPGCRAASCACPIFCRSSYSRSPAFAQNTVSPPLTRAHVRVVT